MHTFLMATAIMSSILLIIVVLLQDSKSGGLSGLTGGAEELFGKQKVRGAELVLQRITIVLGLIFFISLVCNKPKMYFHFRFIFLVKNIVLTNTKSI